LAGDYIGGWRPKFMTMYFRLIGATWNTTDATPEFFYSGPQSYAVNGYQVVREPGYPYGESVEWDQFKDNASPTPDSPVCPANKCGVAMQQFQEISGEIPPSPPDPVYFLPVIIAEADHVVKEDDDRIYYVYVRVNHPLYFRRSLTVLTRVKKTKSLPLPAETTYINTYTTYVPTDKNYVTNTYKNGLNTGTFNLGTGTTQVFKIALYINAASLDATTTAYTTTGEVTDAGYTAGGQVLTISQVPTSSGTTAYLSFATSTWTSASFTAAGALIYNSTQGNKAVAVLDFGGNQTVSGGDFNILFPTAGPTTAILRLE